MAEKHSSSSQDGSLKDVDSNNDLRKPRQTPEERLAALQAAVKIDPGPVKYSLRAFHVCSQPGCCQPLH